MRLNSMEWVKQNRNKVGRCIGTLSLDNLNFSLVVNFILKYTYQVDDTTFTLFLRRTDTSFYVNK